MLGMYQKIINLAEFSCAVLDRLVLLQTSDIRILINSFIY